VEDDGTDREQLRVDRELSRQDDRRLRVLKLTGVAVFVVGIATLAGIAVGVTGKGGSESTQERPVVTGPRHAPATLTVYEDFRCRGCRDFEERFGGTVEDLQRSGDLKTEHHLVARTDDTRGGHGSERAAEAALCALDEHKFTPYRRVLYEEQPPERKDTFASREHLLRLAAKVPGLSTREFERCVRHGLQAGRADRMNAAYADSRRAAPPLVLLDGERLDVGHGGLTPRELRESVARKRS
jgi:hypothetical protein